MSNFWVRKIDMISKGDSLEVLQEQMKYFQQVLADTNWDLLPAEDWHRFIARMAATSRDLQRMERGESDE